MKIALEERRPRDSQTNRQTETKRVDCADLHCTVKSVRSVSSRPAKSFPNIVYFSSGVKLSADRITACVCVFVCAYDTRVGLLVGCELQQ